MSYTCSRKMLFFAAVLCALTTLMASAQNTCHIGNDGERQVARTNDDGTYLYLDIDHPTSCAGIITSWRLCYYSQLSVDTEGSKQKSKSKRMTGSRSQKRKEYWATFAVYRKTGDGSRYVRVLSRFSSTRSTHSITVMVTLALLHYRYCLLLRREY